ncbi:MAG: signal peptidase I [Thermoplasmata archaeon]
MPEAFPGGSDTAPARPPPWWARWRSRRVVVHDESMEPTLRPRDRLLVDRSAYREHSPSVGDIVVLVDPDEPSRWLVKRVAGIGPGDFWQTRTGLTTAFTTSPNEAPPSDAVEKVTLPTRSVFVMGDAPSVARDSRQFGPVRVESVVGRVYRCYAPPDRCRDL